MKIFDAGNGFVGFGSSYIPKGNISINVDGLFLNGFRVTFFNPSAPLSYGTFLVTEIQKADNSFCTDLNDLLAYVLPIFQVSSGGGGSQNLQSVLDNGNRASGWDIILGSTFAQTEYGSNSIRWTSQLEAPFAMVMQDGLVISDLVNNLVQFLPTSQSFIDSIGSGQPSFTIDNAAATTIFFDQSGGETFRMDRVNQEVYFSNIGLFDIVSNSFNVSSQVYPGIFSVDGLNNITSFNTDSFSVGSASFADMFVVDGLSNSITLKANPIRMNEGGIDFFYIDPSLFDINVTDSVFNSRLTTGSNGSYFGTNLQYIFGVDTQNSRIEAFAPIIATDTIGDYIKCETPSGPRAIRLDTII